MTKHQAKFYVKNHLNEYLSSKGINTRKPFRCLNPLHNDKNPSMSYDSKRKKAHCFACGADYDTFDLIAIDYNIQDNGKIFKKAYDYFKISFNEKKQEQVSEYITRVHKNASETDYFKKRGLSDIVINSFSLGYDSQYNRGTGEQTWKAAIIPTGINSFTARNTDPNADKLNRIRKQGGSPVFNFDKAIDSPGPVFIVEGEFDALSIIEAGGNAVALGSTVNWRKAAFLFKGWVFSTDNAEQQSEKRRKPIVVSLDNDSEGRSASEKLLNDLKSVFTHCVDINVSLGYKDANEALERVKEAFVNKVQETIGLFSNYKELGVSYNTRADESCEYQLQHSAAFSLKALRIAENWERVNISTGFVALDTALGGGLFPSLYVIGAISSLGKTTFILQMADNIAACGNDALIFSLEMSKRELIAKSVSRHTLLGCLSDGSAPSNAKSSLDIMCGANSNEIINAAMDTYAKYAANVYINESAESIDDVRSAVESHISFTGKKPVVFIDYIQILGNGNMRGTDKQHMDRNVTELKRISRHFQIPVIGVSSFNRQSYREAVTMEAFKESGAIEYSSDVLLGLQLLGAGKKDFDVDKEKMKNPRAVLLKVLKNRNGRAGEVVSYSYYPEYNYFKEV